MVFSGKKDSDGEKKKSNSKLKRSNKIKVKFTQLNNFAKGKISPKGYLTG